MRKILAIDNGKMNLKATDGKKIIVYGNNYSIGFTDEGLLGENTFNVTYGNKQYTMGENANLSDTKEGKGRDIHIVSTLTAITRFINKKNDKVILMYGESVDKYFDPKAKQCIKEKLEGHHNIIVNNEKYDFEIEVVQVLPEGIGHIIMDLNKYSGEQYVVDMGGTTINLLCVKDGRPEEFQSFSSPLGMHILLSSIETSFKRHGLMKYDQKTLLKFIENGSDKNEVNNLMQKVIDNHLENFNANVSKKGIDLSEIANLTFTGGSSALLKNRIINIFPNANIIDEPLLSNVKGFHFYGVAKYNHLLAGEEENE